MRLTPLAALAFALVFTPLSSRLAADDSAKFHVEETTIADLQAAILAHQITATEIVKLYLARIKAYNGPGVEEPNGILAPIKYLAHAKGINALGTLNLRPATRKAMGFDDRKARSMTDAIDNDPALPDALETAAEEDRKFAATGQLVGPLHGVVFAIKDQYDTVDMRTTSGADAFYADDRPPADATFVQRLRAAGAIILAKANMGEYAGGYGGSAFRSSFAGSVVNPYDTERSPGGSSSGSGACVAANLVTCAISEETGPSVRWPSSSNNIVGLAPTQELVSRTGMMNQGINTRVGPATRTVEDAARILDVIAGYDPTDEMTAFSVGRTPSQPYASFARGASIQGMRIGIVREYMDRTTASKAEIANIEIAEKAIVTIRSMGAVIVDPGPGGLFTDYVRRYAPMLTNASFTKAHPDLFPVDEAGKPKADFISILVDLAADPSKVPGQPDIKKFPPAQAAGEGKFGYDLYLRRRGDSNIKTLGDLIHKARFFNDGQTILGKPVGLEETNKAMGFDTAVRLQRRFAIQQIVLQCMAEQRLDAVVYPTCDIPPPKLDAPKGGGSAGANSTWTFLGQQGFPAITVPGGFTTEVYDRAVDPPGHPTTTAVWIGPTPARLPAGIDFLGRPFSEPILFRIAAAYEQATHHRMPPPDFGSL